MNTYSSIWYVKFESFCINFTYLSYIHVYIRDRLTVSYEGFECKSSIEYTLGIVVTSLYKQEDWIINVQVF